MKDECEGGAVLGSALNLYGFCCVATGGPKHAEM